MSEVREPLLVSESEKLVLLSLRNPATGRGSTKFKYAGAVDLIKGTRVIDWKSTSNPDNFMAKKEVGFQPECYALALKRMGYDIDEYEYRVIQTPSIRFSGKDVNAAAYEDRCVEWIKSKPNGVQSIIQPFTEESLKQAEEWLWAVSRRVMLARKTGSYLTNETACDSYGKQCPYLPLCRAAKNGDSVGGAITAEFEVKKKTHSELELPPGTSEKDVLTYSSSAKFSLCEQRYYWGNVLALERKGESTSDALYIGSAMHAGLEHLEDKGIDYALGLIEEWRKKNPVIGANPVHKQEESVAKARAMVRVASDYWQIG